ncbi:hypothetical protein [Ruegeria sp. MALMAid1280]|uniref:hypothetical protein n=1 Tax=Ruegeria sp. MALMAid1280 TaxID=3411634 RepID=UPI003B9EB715
MTKDLPELPPFEIVVYRAILAARSFYAEWQRHGPEVDPEMQRSVSIALEHLDEGTLFSFNDDDTWLSIEQVLINALNACQDGYGDYAVREDTRYDHIFLAEQERFRRLMESWKGFRDARQRVLDRRRASKVAAEMGN